MNLAVEGLVDEAVGQVLLGGAGLGLGRTFGRAGKGPLLRALDGYNASAQRLPWLVLIDLDGDAPCAGEAVERWLPAGPSALMRLRVAVRKVESWLMADAVSLAAFLGVSRASVPRRPDDLDDPKRALVELARRSRRRAVREGLVPSPRSGRSEGVTYASDLAQYARERWRPQVAAERSPSLSRSLDRLHELKTLVEGSGRGR